MPFRVLLVPALLVAVWGTSSAIVVASDGGTHTVERPEWIWASGASADDHVVLQKTVSLPDKLRQATVEVLADFADAQLRINGRASGHCEPFSPVLQWDVTQLLRKGDNLLELRASGTGGPAAVALRLTWQAGDGRQGVFVTDANWQTGSGDVVSLGRVGRILWEGNREPVALSPLEDYTQWKRALEPGRVTDPSTFIVPAGFEVELIYTARPDQGSWVAMAFDAEGRVTVAREEKGLLRLSMDDARRRVCEVRLIEDTLLECRGLQYHEGNLYAHANNSKALYRLEDADQDGHFEQAIQLHASAGGVGHGRNDLTLGPDGLLYAIHGDAVHLPREVADVTSPAREHRRGQTTREGYLLRLATDGGQAAVLAAGLRNPFGIAFNKHGEAFTYDADAEHDMGAPWYRPTRVNHLIDGADFGWRGVTGSWPPYYPDHADNAPSSLDVGRGSPTAVKFGTGSHFPMPYRDALFVLDWAYGRVIAVHMEPRGSSYACLGETFLQGRPLNVTDLDFGPEGAMYLITGGRNTQSALYRIRYTGAAPQAVEETVQQQARQRHAVQARHQRRALQQMLGKQDHESFDTAWSGMSEVDPWLSYVARTVVEHRAPDAWAERALQESSPDSAAPALLALARLDAHRFGREIVAKIAELPLAELAPRQQLMLLYTGWLCLEARPEDEAVSAALAAKLMPLYPNTSLVDVQQLQWNQWASRILVEVAQAEAVPRTAELLRNSREQKQQLHYLFVLRTADQGWTLPLRRLYFDRLNEARWFEGGAGMPDFLSRIRQEAVATLGDAERASLGELVEAPDHEPTIVATERPLVRRWKLDELLEQLAAGDRRADPERGRQVFREAQCAACHRFVDQGRPLGPDLSHVARRFNSRDVLQAVVRPSEVIADDYRSVQITTTDGKVYSGKVTTAGDFREPTLRLVADLTHPERVTEIPKTQIAESRPSPVSPMPDGLLDTFTADEIADLLAYLQSGGP